METKNHTFCNTTDFIGSKQLPSGALHILGEDPRESKWLNNPLLDQVHIWTRKLCHDFGI